MKMPHLRSLMLVDRAITREDTANGFEVIVLNRQVIINRTLSYEVLQLCHPNWYSMSLYVTDIHVYLSCYFILKCPAFSTPPLTGAIPFFRFGCRLVAWKWWKDVERLERLETTILSRHLRLVGRNSIELAEGGRGDLLKTQQTWLSWRVWGSKNDRLRSLDGLF